MVARSIRFKVLLVEDEVLISEMVAEVLAEQGFEVHAVGSAAEALCILKAGTSIDVLFTDINLGDGMDGVTLAMYARVMRPDLPVVFASGRWATLDGLQDLPRSALLPKPYSPHRAGVVVAQLLAAPGPQSRERLIESDGWVVEHA